LSIRVLRDLDSIRLHGVVLSIGNFDGVHRGHQAIIGAAGRRARAAGVEAVAFTFDPHPLTILAPDRAPATLTLLDEKLRWLEAAGADVAVVVESRPEFFNSPAEVFVEEVILGRLKPIAVVEGPSFRFGRHRQGGPETLAAAGKKHGFEFEVVPSVRVALGGHPDTVISSSLVRHLLGSGTVDQAAVCLGRPYALLGTVQPGASRGRALGFATANLAVHAPQLIPAEGVYAGRAVSGTRACAAAISIGHTPTFDGDRQLVEAHLLDFSGDLYGSDLRLEFLAWIRPQQKFASPAELKRQIELDILTTRTVAQAGDGG
jgi:riboflavin kinase / FMN adenylyltransferase